MRLVIGATVCGLLLGGCVGGFGGNYTSRMTPEQIAAAAKDRQAVVECVVANTPYGRGVQVLMSIDRSVVKNGSVKVSDQCQAEFTSSEGK